MDALQLLETRASNPKLGEPAPEPAALKRVLTAALRAPDHQLLRPWKVFVVQGEGLRRLGDILVESMRAREPNSSPEALEKARCKPLRAPMILVVAACPKPHSKVPEIEQVLSAGAVAQNICLGLHALGYAACWRTGDLAYDPIVKRAFGLRVQDSLIGFVYAGTPKQPPPKIERPRFEEVVEEWTGARDPR
jgi:nitroreductase